MKLYFLLARRVPPVRAKVLEALNPECPAFRVRAASRECGVPRPVLRHMTLPVKSSPRIAQLAGVGTPRARIAQSLSVSGFEISSASKLLQRRIPAPLLGHGDLKL